MVFEARPYELEKPMAFEGTTFWTAGIRPLVWSGNKRAAIAATATPLLAILYRRPADMFIENGTGRIRRPADDCDPVLFRCEIKRGDSWHSCNSFRSIPNKAEQEIPINKAPETWIKPASIAPIYELIYIDKVSPFQAL